MSNGSRVVLALGGAGTVGSGIVKALLDRGKTDGCPYYSIHTVIQYRRLYHTLDVNHLFCVLLWKSDSEHNVVLYEFIQISAVSPN